MAFSPGERFVAWLRRMTAQGIWVIPRGGTQYQLVKPHEWMCEACGSVNSETWVCTPCTLWLPQDSENEIGFFAHLLEQVSTVEDFERECGTVA